MNILQVTLGYYPATAWGGPVKVVHQNSRELVKRGHRVTVYCTNLLNKKEYINLGTFQRQVEGIRVVYFHTWRIPWWPGTLGPIWMPDLPKHLRQEIALFDLVHANGYRNLMLPPIARAARTAGIPYIAQPHGALPIIVNSFLAKHIYDCLLGQQELKGLGALIALQESEFQQALKMNVPPWRIEIIPNGIEMAEYENLPEVGLFRKRYGLDPDWPLILFLGRINKKKGVDMLVEAYALLDRSLNAQLAIVGPDDGQLSKVKQLIHRYELEDNVLLTGLLAGKDVMAAFQDADLFVLPCRADTFPVTIMESCLVRTPMVVTDRCEIAHLVKGRIADVVSFNAEKFARAMERLLKDQQRYERYQGNCSELLHDTFNLSSVVDRLEKLYERVVEENYSKLEPPS